jgi:putative hydrolase of the HAD superfamily
MIRTILFDLDDTLYPPSAGIWTLILARIEDYMQHHLHMQANEIPALRRYFFETYGTTLRGLQLTRGIDTEAFLAYVHDVPVEDCLSPDPQLKQIITSLPQRKLIFTNADTRHAMRVLDALDLAGCFEKIIDIHQVAPDCKPQAEAYLRALSLSGESSVENVAVVDDSPRNLHTARRLGFYTVLVGKDQPDPSFHLTLPALRALPLDYFAVSTGVKEC